MMGCKGKAYRLDLTREYREGQVSVSRCLNPYDFFDEYEKHYAWDIGNQKPVKIGYNFDIETYIDGEWR